MQLVTPDVGLIFWTLIAFLFVFFILKKYAFKPIAEALHERETSIENALRSAAKATEDMKALQQDNMKLLEKAREERDIILKKANEAAENMVNEAKNKAITEGNKMIDDARHAIRQEQQSAIENIKMQVAELSIEIAEKVLKNQLKDQSSQKEFVNDLLKGTSLN